MDHRTSIVLTLFSYLLLVILSSCSFSYLRDDIAPIVNTEGKERKINYSIVYSSHFHGVNDDAWKNDLQHGIKHALSNTNVDIVKDLPSVCVVKIKHIDEENDISNWKVWVSGLSLSIIPMRFESNLSAEIQFEGTTHNYQNDIITWYHIGLLPFFVLTPNKVMKMRELGEGIGKELLKICVR